MWLKGFSYSSVAYRSYAVFDIFLQPRVLLIKHMQEVLAAPIAVSFVRKYDIAYRAAIPFDGIVQAFALDGESAGIVIHFPMDHQQRRGDLVGIHEGAHIVV